MKTHFLEQAKKLLSSINRSYMNTDDLICLTELDNLITDYEWELLTPIRLGEPIEMEDGDYLVSYIIDEDSHIKFYARNVDSGFKKTFKSQYPIQSIIYDGRRKEILDYCLGENNYTDTDKVEVRDIFIHGKFITEIK